MPTKTGIGIDIGSRMTKMVRLADGEVRQSHVFDTGHEPMGRVKEWVSSFKGEPVVVTGYGRHLAAEHLGCRVVTEIRACACGAREVCPDCDSVIDVGGQDSKVIEVIEGGKFGAFEMNDRCAAGTGKFLEVMAQALGYDLEQFGEEAMQAGTPVAVTNLCTVFAESEVVGLIARGEDRRRIALGLHVGTARRIAAMASRIRTGKKVLFVGGVARDACMARALAEELEGKVVVPERPELVVALGSAILARDGE